MISENVVETRRPLNPHIALNLAMETVISNRRWFRVYLIIRSSVLLLAVLWLVAQLAWSSESFYVQLLKGVAIPLLMVVLLFDAVQQPGLFEVLQYQNQIAIRLSQPDTRYFIWHRESSVQTFELQPGDEIELFGEYQALPWNRKVQLVIRQQGGQQFVSNKIDVSWARQTDLKRLLALTKETQR